MNYTKKVALYEKLMVVAGILVLALATYISLFKESEFFEKSIIPYANYVVPIINFICFLLCIFLLIKSFTPFYYIILIIQSLNTMCIGLELLSVFLYSTMILLAFSNGFFKNKPKKRLLTLWIVWILFALASIPFGLYHFFRAIFISFLEYTIYCTVYYRLEKLLIPCFSPTLETNLELPQRGEVLNLSNYNLSERQIKMTMHYLQNNSTYKDLSNSFLISVSTVKKDMVGVFQTFGVKNIKDLQVLFAQYIVKE